MKSRRVPLAFTALMLLSSLSGCIFEQTDAGGDEEVLAVFNYSPSSNIRSGDTITFDASSSTPSGGITYRWDFDHIAALVAPRVGGAAFRWHSRNLRHAILRAPRPELEPPAGARLRGDEGPGGGGVRVAAGACGTGERRARCGTIARHALRRPVRGRHPD